MRIFALAIASVAALIPAASDVRAQPADRHDEAPEDWAWSQIRIGLPADFHSRRECQGRQLDPAELQKEDFCRLLFADAIIEMLTKKDRIKQIGQHGVRIAGAWIVGNIDLADAEIAPAFSLSRSRLDGDLMLGDSRVKQLISVEGSYINGGFSASRMHDDTAIRLIGDTFTQRVALDGAHIGGDLDIDGSKFENGIVADGVEVAGNLVINKTSIIAGMEGVSLFEARIEGSLDVEDSSLQRMNVDLSEIKGAVFFNTVTAYRSKIGDSVQLNTAKIGTLQINHSLFFGKFSINSAEIHNNVLIDQSTFNDEANMVISKIGGAAQITKSTFGERLDAGRTNISGSLFVQDARFWDELKLSGAKIGSFVKLDNVSAAGVDLSEGNAGQLVLSGVRWWCSGAKPVDGGGGAAPIDDEPWVWAEPGTAIWALVLPDMPWWGISATTPAVVEDTSRVDDESLAWEEPHGALWPLSEEASASCDHKEPPKLVLRGFHVADFQGDENAWPPAMDLQGFQYDRLGSLAAEAGGEVRELPREKWKDWLRRDLTFHAQPYLELSSVLATAGRRDMADAVNLAGHERERHEVCAERRWTHPGSEVHCALLTSLFYVAGYGIGTYGFVVFAWVLGFTAIGAFVLSYSVNARKNGYLWRFGASLHWLLPVIELSKEFSNFFENPTPSFDEEPNLSRKQVAYFAVHAAAGWLLGFFLLAAMSGLIQKG